MNRSVSSYQLDLKHRLLSQTHPIDSKHDTTNLVKNRRHPERQPRHHFKVAPHTQRRAQLRRFQCPLSTNHVIGIPRPRRQTQTNKKSRRQSQLMNLSCVGCPHSSHTRPHSKNHICHCQITKSRALGGSGRDPNVSRSATFHLFL